MRANVCFSEVLMFIRVLIFLIFLIVLILTKIASNFALFCSERLELSSAIFLKTLIIIQLSKAYLHPLCTTAQHLFLKSVLLKQLTIPILPSLQSPVKNISVIKVLQYRLAKARCCVDFAKLIFA